MPPTEQDQPPNFNAYRYESPLTEKFNLLDRAARKDMHWWFFALLMIGMAYVGFERWESSKEREELRGEISTVRKDQLEYLMVRNEAMMNALINNTRALELNTHTLNRLESRSTK